MKFWQALKEAIASLTANKTRSFLTVLGIVIGVGAVKAALRKGLQVPRDLAVVGFDNSNLCTVIEPELTSIHIDTQQMGSLSVIALDRIINGKPVENRRICLSTRLVKRSST